MEKGKFSLWGPLWGLRLHVRRFSRNTIEFGLRRRMKSALVWNNLIRMQVPSMPRGGGAASETWRPIRQENVTALILRIVGKKVVCDEKGKSCATNLQTSIAFGSPWKKKPPTHFVSKPKIHTCEEHPCEFYNKVENHQSAAPLDEKLLKMLVSVWLIVLRKGTDSNVKFSSNFSNVLLSASPTPHPPSQWDGNTIRKLAFFFLLF